MNFFEHKTAAARYARCRPYFHLIVMEHIRSYLKLQAPVGQALDVGCGTGQSAVALKSIAQAVVGTDISPDMLAEVEEVSGIRYVEAPAEVIPLPDASFDLITAGLAFHWFDQDRFLSEAQRLLKSGGWLVNYNNGFSGKALLKNNLMIWRGIHTVGWLSGMFFFPPSNGVSDDEAILQGEDASLCLPVLQSASLQCPGPRA